MDESETDTRAGRPFIFSIFSIAIFVYTGTLTLIFLLATLFNGWITKAVDEFFPEKIVSRPNILVLSLIGLLLNGLSFFGMISLWRLRRHGLYILGSSSLLFLILPFLFGYGSIVSILIMAVVIGFFFLYYRRLK